MRVPQLLVSAALALSLGCAAAQAERKDHVEIPPQPVPQARMPTQPYPAVFVLPDGPGPFPAVILMHGCGGGPNDAQLRWAHRLAGWGYASVAPSSFLPRGVYNGVCEPSRQPLVTAPDRAGDVISAALWLRTRPEIDGTRIAVMGFSHGGSTAAWVTQRRYEEWFPHLLKAAIDYYGPCREAVTQGTVPLLVLAGDDDTWGYTAKVCRSFGARLQPGQVFELHTYPGAAHDFDNPGQAHGTMLGHPRGYEPAAAADSYQRVQAFLARYLAAPGG